MDNKIVKLLQEWDYPYQVPKIVFYDKYKNNGVKFHAIITFLPPEHTHMLR